MCTHAASLDVASTSEFIRKAAALWILKTREVHKIPLSVMDNIISDVQALFQTVFAHLSIKYPRVLVSDNETIDSALCGQRSTMLNLLLSEGVQISGMCMYISLL